MEPTIRLLVTPSPKYSLWGAISRSVLIPIEGVENCQFMGAPVSVPPFSLPTFPLISGNTTQVPEEELSYEAGIRGQPTDRFSWDLATFFNRYDNLSYERFVGEHFGPGPSVILDYTFANGAVGNTYGFELASTYKITPAWRLQAAYSLVYMDMHPINVPGAVCTAVPVPNNEFYLQSSFDLGRNWELDLIGRYVDSIAPELGIPFYVNVPASVPKYIVGDVRLAWHPNKNLELSVVGRNLMRGKFYQYNYDPVFGTVGTEVGPEVYAQLAWHY